MLDTGAYDRWLNEKLRDPEFAAMYYHELELLRRDRQQPQDANPDNQEGVAGRGQREDNTSAS